jgi:Ca2+/Na+ antiporter
MLGGELTTLHASVAVALCLIPSAATLALAARAVNRSGEQQLLMVLGGMAIRMACVLLSGLAIYGFFPLFRHSSFWIWVLVFYLVTLALEMVLLVDHFQKNSDQSHRELSELNGR